jgi:hypothetical protein
MGFGRKGRYQEEKKYIGEEERSTMGCDLLGCDDILSGRKVPTFRRILLSPPRRKRFM